MKALLGMCVVTFVLAAGASHAEAKGLVIINTGEDVVEIGEIKPEVKAEIVKDTAPDVKLGIMYSRFGIFWLDIWRWDKKYVFYASNTFWEITEEAAKAAAVSVSKPVTLTVPPGLMVILAIIAIVIVAKVLGRRKQPDAPAPEPNG